ncbi:Arc family DNA-binding protein [uncultured Xylophilus sp.]|uniref:Arc family DNA-binding protein n=1 Tax=uncultured Xylophilus sp. TaxID=296832 RepID=UPI0034566AB2
MTAERHQLTPTPVRIPPDIKVRLQAEAVANDRSLNGEILARLRSTFRSESASQPETKGQQ